MGDPLVWSHVGLDIQLGLERLLYLLHQHRQHLESFNLHFERLRRQFEEDVSQKILTLDKENIHPNPQHSINEERHAVDNQLQHVNQHYTAIHELEDGLHGNLTGLSHTCTALSWSLSILYWSQVQQPPPPPL